jgi:Smg protein
MKENVLDVLLYLFENYFEDEVVLGAGHETVKLELAETGFPETAIDKAFTWLEGLAAQGESPIAQTMGHVGSVRVFTVEEQERLDLECRGFLLFLEQTGVLDTVHREIVIDRVMALESDEVDLEQVKWVAQMVLFNRPGKEEDWHWVEQLVLDQAVGPMH